MKCDQEKLLASLAILLKIRVGQDWQDTVLQHEMHRLLSLMLLAEFLRHPVLSYCSSINHSERRNNTSEFQNIFAALPINNKDDASEKKKEKVFTKALVAAKRQSKEDTTFKFFACQTSTIATISCYFETLVFGFFLVFGCVCMVFPWENICKCLLKISSVCWKNMG